MGELSEALREGKTKCVSFKTENNSNLLKVFNLFIYLSKKTINF